MSTTRLTIPPRLRAAFAYGKLTGATPRMLVLHGEYWLDRACADTARRMGWEVRSTPVRMEGVMPRQMVADLLEALVALRPDFILSINLSGMDEDGLLARLFEDLGIPHVTWFVDDPRTILLEGRSYGSPLALALTWDPAYTEFLKGAGFARVETLPLAADTALFDSPPGEAWSLPALFVGSAMTNWAEREWAWMVARPALCGAMREAFETGRVTRDRFGVGMGALLPAEVTSSLDAEGRRHAELLFFLEGTRRLRHALVEALRPEGLRVCGGTDWLPAVPDALPPVPYGRPLAEVYRTTAVNLNSTSIQMPTAVNQRVFDCPLAGGFLLTDAQGSLPELFDPGTEVVTYGDLEECRDLLRYYGRTPKARRAVVERARARILACHTYAHRLESIAALVRGQFGG